MNVIQERILKEQEKITDLKKLVDDYQNKINELLVEIDTIKSTKEEPKQLDSNYNFFQKIFSKKYKQYLVDKENNRRIRENNHKKDDSIDLLTNQITDLSNSIATLNNSIEDIEKNRFSNLSSLDQVRVLLGENPDLSSDNNFIKEITAINPDFICFDNTDDPSLYINYLKDKILGIEANLELFNKFIEELNNPKEAEPGIYKIPHKYIFESIRSIIKNKIFNDTVKNPYDALVNYFNADCKFTLEYAQTLEKLYSDEDHIFGVHGYGRLGGVASSPNEVESLKKDEKSIFENGLFAPSSECDVEGHNPRLEYTAFYKGEAGFDFLYALTYDYGACSALIFIQLPAGAMDPNLNIPIWGSTYAYNSKEKRDIAKLYILPQYIVGGVIKTPDYKDYIININNGPKVNYPYLYTDGNVGNGGPVNIENQEEIKL